MSSPSIRHQVNYVLNLLVWDKARIDAYKSEHHEPSVKKALRPNGDPTAGLPAILSVRTKACYLQTCTTFFTRAWKLTGKKKLGDLMTDEIIRMTLDTHYRDLMPATLRTVLAGIGKVFLGCRQAGWVKGPSPVNAELRERVRSYREDGDVRASRFGYQPEDALRIIHYLNEGGSQYALPAEIALRCGLRLSEIAGLQGEHIDLQNLVMHIKGKGGRQRTISIPADLVEKLDVSQQYIFQPGRSWKGSFYQALRRAAHKLGITVSGVHRLRANYAQNEHQELIDAGMSDQAARLQISQQLGHNRVSVTRSYVP